MTGAAVVLLAIAVWLLWHIARRLERMDEAVRARLEQIAILLNERLPNRRDQG